MAERPPPPPEPSAPPSSGQAFRGEVANRYGYWRARVVTPTGTIDLPNPYEFRWTAARAARRAARELREMEWNPA